MSSPGSPPPSPSQATETTEHVPGAENVPGPESGLRNAQGPTLVDRDLHPVDVEELRTRVHRTIDEFLDRQERILADMTEDCLPMIEAVRDLMRGGKRLRPAFCYWGWRAAGGQECPEAVRAATSMEFFQAAALIHDDVMDDSDTRRGLPAVHRRFAERHRLLEWSGQSDRFGLAGAVLTGDLCLAWSEELFSTSGLSPQALERGRKVFDRMRTELMAGQYLDMLEQAGAENLAGDPVRRAQRVLKYKSAKYTIEHPLLIGARLAGADDATAAALSAFGLPLGEAFQLRDDLLGVFGNPACTGKPAGDDLREGKRTVLIALTLRLARPDRAAVLRSRLGEADLDPRGVAELQEIITESGAVDRVESMITELTDRSCLALDRAPVDGQALPVLRSLVDVATVRRF
ncbi:MAG: geranylgeranyl diphosphate synthase, type [Actinomycetota bacterium]|nr:geranylgeranyl diphosphate synthase, type [Actinomycetota bacterium]